jgi:hypothetical protein
MASERDETLFAQQQVVRLQALLEAGRVIHSTIQLDDVLNTVLKIVVRELELEGAYFTNFPNRYGDVPDTAHPQEGWLSFPLHDKAGATFTELVVIPPTERTMTLDEVDFLESLAIQASVAIENARFHEKTVQCKTGAAQPAAAGDAPHPRLYRRDQAGDVLRRWRGLPRHPAATQSRRADDDRRGRRGGQGTCLRDGWGELSFGVSRDGELRDSAARYCDAHEYAALERGRAVAAEVCNCDSAAARSGDGLDGGDQLRAQSGVPGDRLRRLGSGEDAAYSRVRNADWDAPV